MKPSFRNPLLRNFVLATTICLSLGQAAHAATIYWDGAASATWGTLANWSTASGATTPDPTAEPGASDDVIFNITSANVASVATLASNKSALSLTFNSTGSTTLRSDNTTTRVLNLGTGGLTINSGAGALTVGTATQGTNLSLAGSQTWINNSSNTANINNTITRSNGSVMNLAVGTSTFTATVHALVNSLVGTWAATGSGTSLRYVTKTSNILGVYSAGTAAADATNLTDVAGTVNYNLADANGVTPATVSANTIRFTGAAGTLAPGATSFTARGLMNAGTGKWTIGTNPISIGSTNELVIIGNTQETEMGSVIQNNGATASAVSFYGAGTLTLSGNNTFTNGLNIGAGNVLVNNAGALNSSTPNVVNFNGNSGTLTLNGNTNVSVAGVNSLGAGVISQPNQIIENANASGVNLNIGGVSTNSTFYGSMKDGTGGGSLGITKVGTGILTLAGTNIFTGTTLINEGVLTITSTAALPGWDTNSRYSVASVATLAVANGVADGNIATMLGTTNFAAGASIGFDTTTANRTYAVALNNTTQGALGLTKLGTNSLTLNQTNSYSGPTSVIGTGGLILQNAGALGTTAGGTSVASGARIELDGGITVTGEAIVMAGNGTNFWGPLQSRTGVNQWTGNINVTANDTRIGAQSGSSLEVSGIISSGVSLHQITFRPQDTTATVIVSGANTYPGPTTLIGGLVSASVLGNVGATSSNFGAPADATTGTITLGAADGSGLRYTGSGETTDRVIRLGGAAAQGGRIDQSATSGPLKFSSPLTAAAGNKTLTLQGSTAGTGEIAAAIPDGASSAVISLVKAGTGTWTLSGTNTNSGTTAVNGGTLRLNYDTGAGGTDDSKLANAALTLAGGTLELVGGTHPETVLSTTLGTGTFSKVVRPSGGAVLQMNAITRNPGASINFSTSGIANTDTLNDASGILGTWATVGGSDWATNSTNGLDGAITAFSAYTDLSNDAVIADGANTNVRINSNGGGGSMTLGSATTTINSLLQNNASQPAIIDPGTTETLRTSAIMIGTTAKGLTIGAVADDGILTAATSGGDLLLRNNSITELLTINSVIANNTTASTLTKVGLGTVVLSGTNTYTGVTSIAEGTLKAGSSTAFNNTSALVMTGNSTLDLGGYNASVTNLTAAATNTITTTGAGSGVDTLTVSALSATSAALFTDNGVRQLALSVAGASGTPLSNVANTFSGGLSIGSTVRISVVNGTVGSPGAITSGPFGRGAITVNGGNVFDTGAQIWFAASNRTLVNDVIVNGNGGMGSRSGTFRIGTNSGALTNIAISGNITANLASAWFGSDSTGDGTALLLSGKLTGGSGFRFFVSSNASKWTTTLNNATGSPNDYAGNTVVNSTPTTLVLGAADQIPNGAGKGNVDVTAGTLNLAGFHETINGLLGTGTIDNVTAANLNNTLTLGDGAVIGTSFTGVIKNTAGTLAITKTGSETQTLTGPNTYSGATTVDGGTLLINGNQIGATGAVQVNTATLGGTGTVGGAVTVASGGTIAPGTDGTIESLNTGTTIIGGTFACDISAASTDQLLVSGDLTLTGSTLDLNVVTPGTGGTYVIATYTGTRTGSLGGSLPTGYSVNYDDANKEIELIVVGSAYDTWGAPYGLATGSEGGDLDNDGLTNFQEFAFGLIPNSGSSLNPITAQLDKTAGTFTYQRLATSGLTYTIWTSEDLSGWTKDITASAGQVVTPGTPNNSVLVTLTGPKPLSATKLFVRVIAE